MKYIILALLIATGCAHMEAKPTAKAAYPYWIAKTEAVGKKKGAIAYVDIPTYYKALNESYKFCGKDLWVATGKGYNFESDQNEDSRYFAFVCEQFITEN